MSEQSHVLVDLYSALDHEPFSVHIHEQILSIWISQQEEGMFGRIRVSITKADTINKRWLVE
jgi:hypothetical protein